MPIIARNLLCTPNVWGEMNATQASDYLSRLDRVRHAMTQSGVDAALLSVGHDLPYLTGYHAMPLERLTMLVVGRTGVPTMVVPRLEVPRVTPVPGVFTVVPWDETEDPVKIVADVLGDARVIAIGDQMWARFLVELLPHVGGARFIRAVDVVGALRVSKDSSEIDALAAAGVVVIVQPGGSQRDDVSIAAANEHGISMIFTARRHFRH